MPSENRTSVFSIDRRETDQHGTFDGGERGRKSRLSNRLANQQGGTGFNVRRSTSDRKNMLLSTHDALNGSAAADLVSSGDESVGKGSVGNGKGKKYGGKSALTPGRAARVSGASATSALSCNSGTTEGTVPSVPDEYSSKSEWTT